MNSAEIIFVGDFCPLGPVAEGFLASQGNTLLGAAVPLFEKASKVVANLETPLCDAESPILKRGPAFHVPPTLAPVLRECGFDAFVLANNHILDQGEVGLKQTLTALDEAGIQHTGAAMTHEEACTPLVMEVDGRQVAILNFAEGEFARAIGEGPGAARLDPWETPDRVRQARARYDIVIVVLHTGAEYQPIPSPATVRAFRALADAGAHAVMGHHSHIPQAWEMWNGIPICYGLGNFLFGKQYSRACWRLAEVAILTLSESGVSLDVQPLQQKPDFTLDTLTAAGQEAFSEYTTACRKVLSDPQRHQRFWEQEVRELFRDQWPGWIYKLSIVDTGQPPESLLQHLRQMYRRKRLGDPGGPAALFYNLINCDAHREVLLTAGRLLYEDRFTQDEDDVKAELSRLENLLENASPLA